MVKCENCGHDLALSALRAQSVDQAENRAKIAQRKPISNEGLEAVANKEFGINDEDFAAELAIELLALRAQAQGSEAVAVWKHLPDGNNWLVVQPKFRGITWPAEVPLYASPPVQAQPQGVMVKALEWVPVTGNYMPETYEAVTPCGLYQVFTDEDSAAGAVFAEWANDSAHFGMTSATRIARAHSFEAAKAAAQADYERRILSALATPPAPVAGGVRHAFRNADESDWQHLFAVLPDTGRGKFWQAVMKEARAALTASSAAVAQDETP